MDFSLAALSPEERAAMQESIAQKQRVTDLLRTAGQRANRHNNLAAVAQMAGNPGIAKAALLAQKNAQQEASPIQMGQQGFMLPDQGEFVESPMYVEEKKAGRQAQADNLRAQLEARAEQARMLEQGRNERAGEGNELRRLLATQAEAGRQDRLSQTLALRELLANKAAESRAAAPVKEMLTAKQQEGVLKNRAALTNIDKALADVESNPDAFGLHNTVLPDMALQRLPGKGNKGGVTARASVANIGSLKIHDRSGAAVTASEFPRLRPFIPLAGDSPDVVKTKLQGLKTEYSTMLEEMAQAYPDSQFLKRLNAPDSEDDALINKYLPKGK